MASEQIRSAVRDGRTLSPEALNRRRRAAVRLRLDGASLAETARRTGLSAPTIIAAHKAYRDGGWAAVDVRPRGRPAGGGRALSDSQQRAVLAAMREACAGGQLWHAEALRALIGHVCAVELGERTVARYLQAWQLVPPDGLAATRDSADEELRAWYRGEYGAVIEHSRRASGSVIWAGESALRSAAALGLPPTSLLHARGARGRLTWQLADAPADASAYQAFFEGLADAAGRKVFVMWRGVDVSRAPELAAWLAAHRERIEVIQVPGERTMEASVKHLMAESPPMAEGARMAGQAATLTHLQRLEAESIHIMREVVAEAENPVMLYSIGKDSAVMLHLAIKAFYPAKPPFPLLHVDTRWKFREMYAFRDKMAKKLGLDLIVHINPDGVAKDINPFTHGSAIHTDIMKTEGLKQALDKHGFDAAFGGARRDEEKSRAKERIFSFRSAQHRWDPKHQRPELWKLYNARKHKDESMRVFPLSNWTELDIWQYIFLENIPIVPLYYAAERPVVVRDGTLIMVDDGRMPLKPGEVPMLRKVRFRTLGCYPLTGAVESDADTLPAIIQEMLLTKTSERQGRVIDHDAAASMEKKKQEGYF